MLTVRDLMTVHPAIAEPDTSLREVIRRMAEANCRQLPVVSAEGRLVGIVTDRDIRLALESPLTLHERWLEDLRLDQITAESCMTEEPVTVGPDEPAAVAAEILIERKFGALPVVEKDAVIGIVTVTDILRQFIRDHPLPSRPRPASAPAEPLVFDLMTPNPIVVSVDATLEEAHNLMILHNVRRLPVLEAGQFVGFISLADIQGLLPAGAERQLTGTLGDPLRLLPVSEAMRPCPVAAQTTMKMDEASRLMLEHNLTALPVMDGDRFVGIVTESDIFRRRIQSWEDHK